MIRVTVVMGDPFFCIILHDWSFVSVTPSGSVNLSRVENRVCIILVKSRLTLSLV